MKENIKKVIIKILTETDELCLTRLKGYESFRNIGLGDIDWVIKNKDNDNKSMNILFITGLNIDTIDCFYELSSDGIIKIVPAEFWIHAFEGSEIYDLPIAKDDTKTYKTLHWSPRLIKRGINFKLI